MHRYLDLEQWPRKRTFDYFQGFDNPFFNVSVQLDATALRELTRARPEISFFLAYLYLSLRTANEIEAFRYRIEGERVRVYDRIHAGTTFLRSDESFDFAYFDYLEDFRNFHAAAREALDRAQQRGPTFDPEDGRDDLIHYSSLPWIAFTSFAHARNWRRQDSIPKIVFGRCSEEGGRWRLPISVEVHHALMDGLHVGRYLERLQAALLAPEGVLLGDERKAVS